MRSCVIDVTFYRGQTVYPFTFSAGGLRVASTTNPGSSSTFVENCHQDRWSRTRHLTLELVVGHWSGAMNFKNLDLRIKKMNPIRQKK